MAFGSELGSARSAKWGDASSRCARRSPTASADRPTRLARKSSRSSRIPTTSATRSGSPSRSAGSGRGHRSRASTRSPPRRRRMSSPQSISRATNNLRLVVKGGGHSYQGTSNAADSLLVWTRHMNAITTHDAFVGAGCAGSAEPQPAVSIEAGAIWGHAYNEVTTKGGPLCAGRRLHDGRRRRPRPRRRLRQLLQGLRTGRREPVSRRKS